jgi:4-cresol dehydrogenase (hydroxylating) flavoprotein subunit
MSMDMNRRAMLGTAVVGAAASLVACKENPAPLAPSVSKADFKGAVAEMRRVVGDEWVFADTDAVIPYSKTFIPDPTHRHVPVGAVAPATVEEVQELVKIANKYKQPLWTVSTGKNMGYGMAAPATPGQMVLDLKRMRKSNSPDVPGGTSLSSSSTTFASRPGAARPQLPIGPSPTLTGFEQGLEARCDLRPALLHALLPPPPLCR